MEKKADQASGAPSSCVHWGGVLVWRRGLETHVHIHAPHHTHTHTAAVFPALERKAQQGAASNVSTSEAFEPSKSAVVRVLTRERRREQRDWTFVLWAETQSLPGTLPPPSTFLHKHTLLFFFFNLKISVLNQEV